MKSTRRSFIGGLGALIAGAAIEKAIPFNRSWFLPAVIKPKNLWDEINRLTLEHIRPDLMVMESTAYGVNGWYYKMWKAGRLRIDQDAPDSTIYLLNEKYLEPGWDKPGDLLAPPAAVIVSCPISGVEPVEIETALVREASGSELPLRPVHRGQLLGRPFADFLREAVAPIESAVRARGSARTSEESSLLPPEIAALLQT